MKIIRSLFVTSFQLSGFKTLTGHRAMQAVGVEFVTELGSVLVGLRVKGLVKKVPFCIHDAIFTVAKVSYKFVKFSSFDIRYLS